MEADRKVISLLLVSLLLLGSACTSTRVTSNDPESLEALLKDSAGVVFCKYCLDSSSFNQKYEFTSEIITDPLLISEWKHALIDAEENEMFPLIGILTHLLFFDQQQKPIALVYIVNWKCIVHVLPITHYRRGKNCIVMDSRKTDDSSSWTSEPFVRGVYNYMQIARPNELQEARDF